jgi:hypothetical protein
MGSDGYPAWRWAVLLAFSANSFGNSFLFMDFNVVPDVAKVLFGFCVDNTLPDGTSDCDGVGDQWVLMTYGASLFAVMPAFFPVLKFIGTHNWMTMAVGFTCQFIGAWLRWVCCDMAHGVKAPTGSDYGTARTVALISSGLIGFGAAVIICSYSLISTRWFPQQERTMATTIPVMSNYAGWCLGCLLIPYTITSPKAMLDMQFYQGIVMTLAFGAFLVCHRERPERGRSADLEKAEHHEQEVHDHDMVAELKKLFSNQQFVVQCFCYSILAGVSFAVPGFGTVALKNLSLSATEAAWVNFAFVFSGVVTGTSIGRLIKGPRQFPAVLKTMFLLTSIALAVVVVLVIAQDKMSKSVLYPILIVAMAVSGATSLGFIGVALSAVIETTHPVDAEFSGGSVEWFVQLWGGIFTFASSAPGMSAAFPFWLVTIPTWIATLLMFTVYKQDFLKTGGGDAVDSDDEAVLNEKLVSRIPTAVEGDD